MEDRGGCDERARRVGHTPEHLAIYDDVDLLRQKLETFAPDVLFNLVEQFRNKSEFDQNIVSFFEMQGLPFTGCGSTGLTLCKHKGISKKILHYHGIHVPNFVVIPRGQRIARLKQPKFPLVVKPVKEEASYGISQASFVGNDDQFRERVTFIHARSSSLVIAGPGLQFLRDIRFQRRLFGDLAGETNAEDHRLHVVVGAQIVEQHRRRSQRVGAARRTVPRPSGRRCTGLIVKPGNGCGTMPVLARSSVLHSKILSWISGRSSRGSQRVKTPAWMPLLAIGPERNSAYRTPA